MRRKASRLAVSPGKRGTSSTSDTGRAARGKAAGRTPASAKTGPAAKPARAGAAASTNRPAGTAAKRPAAPKAKRPAAAKARVAPKAKAPAKTPAKAAARRKAPAKTPAKTAAKTKAPAAKTRPAARAPKARPSAAPVLPIHPIAGAAPPPAPPPLDRSAVGHHGLRELDWTGFAAVARELSARIAARFRPDVVIGLAKGGVFVGEELARSLARPFVAVHLEKRSRDGGRRQGGAMPDDLLDRRVLLVDDVAGTGEALETAAELALGAGAREVRTAAVIARPGRFRPDFAVEETNDLWVLPWDYEPPTGAGSAGE